MITVLPLLRRELTEMASQRRTMRVVRVAFAIGFSASALVALFSIYSYSTVGSVLGQGGELHGVILILEALTVGALMPVFMVSTFPSERERGSYELLRLTRLTSFELVLETFLGRLITVLSILLLMLPIRAVAYSLGGVTTTELWVSWYIISLFAIQVGAVAIAFAGRMARPVPAYLAVLSFTVGIGIAIPWLSYAVPSLGQTLPWLFGNSWDRIAWLSLSHLDHLGPTTTFLDVVGASGPAWVPVAGLLAFTMVTLPRSAARPRGRLRGFWRRTKSSHVAVKEPVAWRERHRSAGMRRWVLLLWVGITVITVIVLAQTRSGSRLEEIAALAMCCWGAYVLALLVLGVNAIVSERTDQTLDVLLTTPLRGGEIVGQKLRGLIPAAAMLAAPIVGLLILSANEPPSWGRAVNGAVGLAFGFVVLALYTPVFLILGFLVGLKSKRKMRAILASVLITMLWVILPLFMAFCGGGNGSELFFLTSPAFPPVVAHIRQGITGDDLTGSLAVVVMFYGLVLLVLIAILRQHLDHTLGRHGADGR